MKSLSVIIVDDHAMVRKGLSGLIVELGWAVTSEAGSLEQARDVCTKAEWDLLVLDINLPDGSGMTLVPFLRGRGYSQPILVHSLMPDAAAAAKVFKLGGSGFISKDCHPDDFLAACKRLAAGGRYISPEYAEELAMTLVDGGAPQSPHETLSSREYQVMCLIAEGKTPTQIAAVLQCNVNSISTFRARVLKKLGLKTTMDIAHYAIGKQLIAPPAQP